MANQLTLHISGMHCGACVRRVTQALERIPGVTVEDVQVGLASVRVQPDGIRSAIETTGFSVKSEEERA
jgi:copper chaperone